MAEERLANTSSTELYERLKVGLLEKLSKHLFRKYDCKLEKGKQTNLKKI